MKNVLDKNFTGNRNTHFRFTDAGKYGGARGTTNDVTIWRIRVACWISKATRTHTHAHAHTPKHTHARSHTHTEANL